MTDIRVGGAPDHFPPSDPGIPLPGPQLVLRAVQCGDPTVVVLHTEAQRPPADALDFLDRLLRPLQHNPGGWQYIAQLLALFVGVALTLTAVCVTVLVAAAPGWTGAAGAGAVLLGGGGLGYRITRRRKPPS